jgi:cell wall assembly regulator SMI1
MIHAPRYRYEITYAVAEECREQYDQWIPEAMIGWLERSEVEVFQSYRDSTGATLELKLVFQFADRDAWANFVESEVHEENVDQLRSLSESLTARLWKPSVIPLNADDPIETPSACDPAAEGKPYQ